MLRFSLQIPLKIINFGINPIAYALHRIISMKEEH